MRIHADLSVEDKAIDAVVERLQRAVEKTIAAEIGKLTTTLSEKGSPQPTPTVPVVPPGVSLPQAERLKAADLRTAILLGKIPEDTGLLIDVKTTAKLLNVSERMVYRLADQKAAPTPIKLGALVRWRLAEIIEWIDSGCPSRWQWPRPKSSRR